MDLNLLKEFQIKNYEFKNFNFFGKIKFQWKYRNENGEEKLKTNH